MSESIRREIFGILKDGTWIPLGNPDMTNAEVNTFLKNINYIYSTETNRPIVINSSIFFLENFIGIIIRPHNKEHNND